MSFEVLVGLQVIDNESYSKYRHDMTPLLEACGGGFRYDFKIAETLKCEDSKPINRLFAIFFKDEKQMQTFFSDKEYLAIREKYFDSAVEATTIIAKYIRN